MEKKISKLYNCFDDKFDGNTYNKSPSTKVFTINPNITTETSLIKCVFFNLSTASIQPACMTVLKAIISDKYCVHTMVFGVLVNFDNNVCNVLEFL